MKLSRIKPTLLRTSVLCASLLSLSANAEIIAYDLTPEGSLNLTSHVNQYEAYFTSPSDVFRRFSSSLESVPDSLLDRTAQSNGQDNLGIYSEGGSNPFFAAVDTVNADGLSNPELAGFASAYWHFDVSGYDDLSVSLDLRAMGDFEASDKFRMDYQLDGGQFQSVWSSSTDQSSSFLYQMASGKQVALNDPLYVEDTLISNLPTTVSHLLNGTGGELVLRFSAKADGGTEVFGFNNLFISGNLAMVSTPGAAGIFLVGLALVLNKRRRLSVTMSRLR